MGFSGQLAAELVAEHELGLLLLPRQLYVDASQLAELRERSRWNSLVPAWVERVDWHLRHPAAVLAERTDKPHGFLFEEPRLGLSRLVYARVIPVKAADERDVST